MPSDGTELLHICSTQEWEKARLSGEHRPTSLADLGFIHLSAREQVHVPANRLYRGRSDLLLLHIDANRLQSPVRWEEGLPSDPEFRLFPHLYGALPIDAVTDVDGFQPGPDGFFEPLAARTS